MSKEIKKLKGKVPHKRKKLQIPEIITEDLTYYMQFGFNRQMPRYSSDSGIKEYKQVNQG
jgi:hypothetical protein